MSPYKPEYNQSGMCYKCGSYNISYTNGGVIDGAFVQYKYTCGDCKARGQEVHEMTFVENESQRKDACGNPIEDCD